MKQVILFPLRSLATLLLIGAAWPQSGVARYEDQRFHSDNPSMQEGYAYHVAMDGEWAAIGMRTDSSLAINSGAVRLFSLDYSPGS